MLRLGSLRTFWYFLEQQRRNTGLHMALIVISGESNSGGVGHNKLAFPYEVGNRPTLKILNNTTLASFDTLHISAIGDGQDNTHVGHVGFQNGEAIHGWELELANLANGGSIANPIYLVKTGQGGSRIAEWQEGYPYTETFNARVDAALVLRNITAPTNKFVLFYSQGINDISNDGWSKAGWVASTIARFNYLRNRYGMFPIVMTLFMNHVNASFEELNQGIVEVCSTLENCWSIQTDDLTGSANLNGDGIHWNYQGVKTVCDRLVNETIAHGYSLGTGATYVSGATITGSTDAGATLTAGTPVWTGAATTSLKWFKNGAATGVHSPTYNNTVAGDSVFVRYSVTTSTGGTAYKDSNTINIAVSGVQNLLFNAARNGISNTGTL